MARALPAACLLLLSSLLLTSCAAFRTGDHEEPEEPASGWFWGSIDANIDWCERNYDTSPYLAEFWNALSSLPITTFAVAGYYLGVKHARIEPRYAGQAHRSSAAPVCSARQPVAHALMAARVLHSDSV